MGSTIEWTDETWNPVVGCSVVSPGCTHCYAAGVAHRAMQPAHEGLTFIDDTNGATFNGTVRCLPERLDVPLRWRKQRRVFVNSMSDLFHPDVPAEFVAETFSVMAASERHTYQVLTKRPQRMATWANAVARCEHGWLTHNGSNPTSYGGDGVVIPIDSPGMQGAWPLRNVWLGTSIESDRYTFRADHLRATPAAVRFLSLEPLLGPLPSLNLEGIDWVIVGGESGAKARPMHPDWVRDLRDRCQIAGIPFLFKQWGNWQDGSKNRRNPGKPHDRIMLPDGQLFTWDEYNATFIQAQLGATVVSKVGKKEAGRELDDRTWDEFPA